MPFPVITAYLERLPVRQAELKLLLADVVSLPSMKKGDRTSTINGWMRLASMALPDQRAKVASPGLLKLMGIGVRRVPVSKGDSDG